MLIEGTGSGSYFIELRKHFLIFYADPGSGIDISDPGWKKVVSGINIPDPQHRIDPGRG
jgi:hypothetical protein